MSAKMMPPMLLMRWVVVCHKDIYKLALPRVIPGIMVPTSYNNFGETEFLWSRR